jgi:hypothetical protein
VAAAWAANASANIARLAATRITSVLFAMLAEADARFKAAGFHPAEGHQKPLYVQELDVFPLAQSSMAEA